MKQTIALGATAILLVVSGIYAFGDIARPKVSPLPKEGKGVLYTSLSVAPDSKISEARLQISEKTLKTVARLAGQSESDDLSMTQRLMHSSSRTVMAGLFMFLAVSFGGVWLARTSQRRNRKGIAAVMLIAAAFGLAAVIVRANAGPPGYIRWQNLPANLTKGQATDGGVDIEIMPGDDSTIKLIVPMRKTSGPGE
jgi:hypothetical protein